MEGIEKFARGIYLLEVTSNSEKTIIRLVKN
jgi:hypothetical protein